MNHDEKFLIYCIALVIGLYFQRVFTDTESFLFRQVKYLERMREILQIHIKSTECVLKRSSRVLT